MQTLVIVLFILTILSFAIQLQLFKNRWLMWGWLVIVALFTYSIHYWTIEQSYTKFRAALTDSSLMTDFAVLQVVEALAGILLSIFLIRSHYNEPVGKFFRYALFLPGIILFPALFYLESMLFLQVHGMDFRMMAVAMALVVPIVLFAGKKVFSILIPEFDLQLEMKFMVHILQLIGAIILSVVMLRLPVPKVSDSSVSTMPMVAMLLTVLMGSVMGMLWYRVKMKRIKKRITNN
ncbi:MAG: hypothetical protein JEZ14_19975 [Marinilabiliaceae bacterium]|nr:hypothetical protein [Marinilabiliaceae bacterium]